MNRLERLSFLRRGGELDYWDDDKMRNILKKPVDQRTPSEKAAITRTRNQEARDRKEAEAMKAEDEKERQERPAKEAKYRKVVEAAWRRDILGEIDYIAYHAGIPTEVLMARVDRFFNKYGDEVFNGRYKSLEGFLSIPADKLTSKAQTGELWTRYEKRDFLYEVERIAASLVKKAKVAAASAAEEAAARAAEEAAARAAEKEAIAVALARARDKQAKEAKATRPRKRPVDPRPLKDGPCTEGKERSARSGRCVKPCRPGTARNEAGRCTKRQAEGKPMLVRGPRAK